jgi:DNA (cytosine-5)-methyltransferase 1
MRNSLKKNKTEVSHIDKQMKLLAMSEQSNKPLSLILQDAGWSYDHLVYEHSNKNRWNGRPPLSLKEISSKKNESTSFVSFFTGCGGMDLGFEAAGYKHIAAFEINDLFCKTLRRNRPKWKVFGPPIHSGDVSDFEKISEPLSKLIKTPFEGVFIGGPPCQPFSIASNQRFSKSGENFKRTGFSHEKNGNLLFDYVKLITAFKPSAFVIENVPGLRDLDNGEQLSIAIKLLKSEGYHVQEPFVLDAANFGIPQQRFRLFVIGSRKAHSFKHPAPLKERIGAGSVLQDPILSGFNTETREHKAESIIRYMKLNYGERDQLGRVDRLDPALPSKTVIAGGTKGGGRSHLHPEIPRTLSVRECARLQSFPDEYIFIGPTARQFTQVGNAVPPVLAAQIANSISNSFF